MGPVLGFYSLVSYWNKRYIIGKSDYWKIRIWNKIGHGITKNFHTHQNWKNTTLGRLNIISLSVQICLILFVLSKQQVLGLYKEVHNCFLDQMS